MIHRHSRRTFLATALAVPVFVRAVAFAINEPEDLDINEILFRPTPQPV